MTRPQIPRGIVSALVGVLAVAAVLPFGAAKAADDSNIPGVPLPGSVVSGQLGGPIYDVVYSISVQPDRFVLLSLTGDPGTDFDLYLFDASATTVYDNVGVVASSTGPTSTESITYGTQSGGTFYIDLNGASNVEGAYRLSVSILTDTTPPFARLLLDGGASATNDQAVRVTLVATDDSSGVVGMQFSTDGTTWGPMRPYQPATLWTFPGGDGQKQLYARVQDASGNFSKTVSASITLDTLAPTIVSRDPLPDAVVGLRPTFQVTFSEPIDLSTWSDLGLLIQDPSGNTVPGVYGWDAVSNIGTFTPSVALVPGLAYVVSMGAIRDLAGNPLAELGSWLVHPLVAHVITLRADPSVVAPGATSNLIGTVSDAPQTSYFLEQETSPGVWTGIAGFALASGNSFTIPEPVTANAVFRVHLLATRTDAESFSAPIRVLVRPQLAIAGPSSTVTRTVARSKTVSLRATINPASLAIPVTLTTYRYDTARRTWLVVGKVTRTTANGTAAFSWRPTTSGSWYLRLTTPSTPMFANATSAMYRWTVR